MWTSVASTRSGFGILAILALLTTGTQGQWSDFLRSVDLETRGLADEVPELGMLLGEDPLDTSLADAVYSFGPLDSYTPGHPSPIQQSSIQPDGTFLLAPGTYTGDFQSFCLRAGTWGPGGGDGYLDAPLRGPQADLIHCILRNSVLHPEIRQQQVQRLLWAVVSRSGIRDMPQDLVWTAVQLLTPAQIVRLNGDAVGWLSRGALARLIDHVPQPLRDTFEADNQLRRLLGSGADDDTLQAVAILEGLAPWGEGSRTIPQTRWSYNPNGYFVRYQPRNAHHTTIEVLRPGPVAIHRDPLERIVALEDASQHRIEVEYDDSGSPLAISGSKLLGYPFSRIRFIEPGDSQTPPAALEWIQTGWTWMGWQHRVEHEQLLTNSTAGTFFDAHSRLATATTDCASIEEFAGNARALGVGRNLDPYRLADLTHFAEGIRAAVRTGGTLGAPWVPRHLEILSQAVAFETCRQMGGCAESESGLTQAVTFDPSERIAVPANTARQRLGISARLR